jgi:hypothetical protein
MLSLTASNTTTFTVFPYIIQVLNERKQWKAPIKPTAM